MKIWMAALRSRKYKQQTFDLYGKNNQACALGVAGRELLGGSDDNYKSSCDIMRVLEIDGYFYDDIVRLNDVREMKFYQIARYIERKLKYEFSKVST